MDSLLTATCCTGTVHGAECRVQSAACSCSSGVSGLSVLERPLRPMSLDHTAEEEEAVGRAKC